MGRMANEEEGPTSVDARRPEAPPTAAASAESWGTAIWKSAVVLVLAVLGFVVVPDRLFSYLALHVGPRLRDTLVLLEVVVVFVLLTWLFVRFQRPRRTT
jgi:hypothetical protein